MNDDYITAHKAVEAELRAGHIKAFACGYTKTKGRYIEVQTDQGWNPEPFWQEIEPEPYLGNNDGMDWSL